MTPHISAKKGEIARIVIMPGDPLRAEWIANNFLQDTKLVNNVRNMYAFTGKYNSVEITVMAHGMGIPSIGIYSYELYNYYDVDTIIRVGSAGSYSKDINLGDVFLVDEAYSDSNYARLLGLLDAKDVLPAPCDDINNIIRRTARSLNIKLHTGRCYSSDTFYSFLPYQSAAKMSDAQVVEMEAYGLFANAIRLNKRAAVLLTCSDSLVTDESMPPEKRQESFGDMVKLALETAIKL